jgi:hypothetical protein
MAAVFWASFRRRAMVWRSGSSSPAPRAVRLLPKTPDAPQPARGSRGRALADGVEHIALEHLTALARTGHALRRRPCFGHQLLRPTARRHVRPALGGAARAAALVAGASRGASAWSPPWPGCALAFAICAEQRVDFDRLAVLGENFAQGACETGAGTSIETLSVSSSTSGSSTLTVSPTFLNQVPMVASRDGFTKGRDADFSCHCFRSFSV